MSVGTDARAGIATVQNIIGHGGVTRTAGYDRRDAKTKRQAVAKPRVPHQKRAR